MSTCVVVTGYSDHCDCCSSEQGNKSLLYNNYWSTFCHRERKKINFHWERESWWLVTVIASCLAPAAASVSPYIQIWNICFYEISKNCTSFPPKICRLWVSWEPKSPRKNSIIRFQVLVIEEEREEPSLCCYWNPIHSLFDFVGTGNPQVLPSLLWCYDFFSQVCCCWFWWFSINKIIEKSPGKSDSC